jgi:hypothetical protein
MCSPERIAWPTKKTMKVAGRLIASALAPKTSALPQSTGSRRGTAAMVERIIPVEYSPVIASTPRTPSESWAKLIPARLTESGWKSARSWALRWAQRVSKTMQARTPIPIASSRVAASA